MISSSGQKQNFSMIGIPFNDVSGENLPVSALKITGYAGTDYLFSDPFDEIQVWDNDTGAPAQFFYCTDFEDWVDVVEYTSMSEALSGGLPAGQSMWYIADSEATREGQLSITIAGGVETDPYVEFYLVSSSGQKQNFSQLTNPYPVAWTVAEGVCKIEGYAGTDYLFSDPFDEIQVWDNETGAPMQYFYCTDFEAWVDVVEYTEMTEVSAGAAFWYIADSEATAREGEGTLKVTFYKPAGI